MVLIWNFWAPKQNEYRWEILEILECSIHHLEMWSKSLSDRSEYHFLYFTGHLSKHFVKRCLEPSNPHLTLSVHTTNKMHVHPTCRCSAEKYLPGNPLWPFLGWSGDPFKGYLTSNQGMKRSLWITWWYALTAQQHTRFHQGAQRFEQRSGWRPRGDFPKADASGNP